MRCPKCGNALTAEEICHSCPDCGGNWFRIEQAREYFGFAVKESSGQDDGLRGLTAATGFSCPDCYDRLVHIEVKPDLVLDQCSRCNGLYFDAGELLKLKSKIGQGVGGPEFRKVLQALIAGRYGPYR